MNYNLFKKELTRRDFCKACIASGVGLVFSGFLTDALSESAFARIKSGGKGFINLKEAMYYKKLGGGRIQCVLCPRNCVLSDGMRGVCRVREPHGGKQYTLVYGNPTSVNPSDPIEKKPLFHFLPGTTTFSIATAGCNFRCKNCQNWQISQSRPEDTLNYDLPPIDAVSKAIEYGCPTIAYTYTDPSIFYEYMLDISKIAKSRGIRNVFHSNGSLNPGPAEEIALYLDGANVDLKGFTQDFYGKIPEGYLDAVLHVLKVLKKKGVWVEITNLIIPTLNDDMSDIKRMCVWIKDNLGKETPVHFSRFYPTYRLKNLHPTPISTLEKARQIAMDVGIDFVYIGNVHGHSSESTYCPRCKKPVIRRVGYTVLEMNISKTGVCKHCKNSIPGVWS